MAASKWFVVAMLLVALVGFIDATYITIGHYSGAEMSCSITNGCDDVLTSEYSVLFGFLPVSVLGVLFYLGMLAFSFATLQTKDIRYIWGYSWLTIPALLWMTYMVYLQLFVIQAICQYCMLSAISSLVLFILGIYILVKNKKLI